MEFDAYLRSERGLAPKSIVRHLPVIRRFLHEVCSGGAGHLCKISQEDVIRYIERHARDWSPRTLPDAPRDRGGSRRARSNDVAWPSRSHLAAGRGPDGLTPLRADWP
jgi:hypothetical protein